MIVFEIGAILIVLYLVFVGILTLAAVGGAGQPLPKPEPSPDAYYAAHKEGADIMSAAAYMEQRKSGRWLGADIVVDWHPGQDTDIDLYALDIEKHGAANGVHVRRVGNGKPLAKGG